MTLKLGYIGLGNQGAPMAKRLVDWPGGLIVFDVRTEAMTPLAELGATLADSVADVAEADVISVTVLNDAQVRDVVGELAAHAEPGHRHRDPLHDRARHRRRAGRAAAAQGDSHRRCSGQRWRRSGRQG